MISLKNIGKSLFTLGFNKNHKLNKLLSNKKVNAFQFTTFKSDKNPN